MIVVTPTRPRPRPLTRGTQAYARRAVAATEALAAAIDAIVRQHGGHVVVGPSASRRRVWRVPTCAGWLTVVVWVSEADPAHARGDLDVFARYDEPARAARIVGCHPVTGEWRHSYGDGDHVPAVVAAARWADAYRRVAPEKDPTP